MAAEAWADWLASARLSTSLAAEHAHLAVVPALAASTGVRTARHLGEIGSLLVRSATDSTSWESCCFALHGLRAVAVATWPRLEDPEWRRLLVVAALTSCVQAFGGHYVPTETAHASDGGFEGEDEAEERDVGAEEADSGAEERRVARTLEARAQAVEALAVALLLVVVRGSSAKAVADIVQACVDAEALARAPCASVGNALRRLTRVFASA